MVQLPEPSTSGLVSTSRRWTSSASLRLPWLDAHLGRYDLMLVYCVVLRSLGAGPAGGSLGLLVQAFDDSFNVVGRREE